VAPDQRVLVRETERVVRLAYTRTQAAQALGISRATFNRRILPFVETIETEWGLRLVPVDEVERFVAERRRLVRAKPVVATRGRPPSVTTEVAQRIQREHLGGKSLGQIARDLNVAGIPTAQGGAQWWPSTVHTILRRQLRAAQRS
jgi:hypothetical protein